MNTTLKEIKNIPVKILKHIPKVNPFSKKNGYRVYENIPMEIAIYDTAGNYKYVNHHYVADPQIAESLINKDDSYYFKFAGIDDATLSARKVYFRRALKEKRTIHFTEKLFYPEINKTLYYKRIFQPIFSSVQEDRIKEICLFGSNLTAIILAQKELKYLAFHDRLTELKNRQAFYEQLDQLIYESDRTRKDFINAILFCDLNNFKLINESLGYIIGDLCLKEVAHRLNSSLRISDSVFRLEGDEFIIILRNLTNALDAGKVAEKIIQKVSEPYQIKGYKISYITMSIGIALHPQDGEEKDILIQNANGAMQNAKSIRKSDFQYFSEKMTETSLERLEMENNLRSLVNDKSFEEQFKILYQPVVEKKLNGEYKIIGCEALLRWNNPDIGKVSPNIFIPLAEQTDLIYPIGEWVMYKAIKDFKSLMKKFDNPLFLSLNLSARQLQSPDIVKKIENIIKKTNVDPKDLQLELTETSFFDEGLQIINNINTLENLGLRIAIDDFGVGFASLKYLQKINASTIKIDRSFIRHIASSDEHKRLVESIILLGNNLHKDIIAEGVENLEHLYLLYSQKCYKYQGYLFSKPVSLNNFAKLLKDENQNHFLKSSMGRLFDTAGFPNNSNNN